MEITLANICQGGIYDHLGGGFARYSVDAHWLVPHFEKMLYDNALLIDLMCEVYREGGNELYARRIDETAQWLLREMIAEGGGFAASLDADCEGEEGKFYVWTKREIVEVLGEADAAIFCDSLRRHRRRQLGRPHHPQPPAQSAARAHRTRRRRWPHMRAKLLARRAGRIRPGWDDKVLADWNGLMIAALAHAARVFDRPDWLAAAETAFKFVLERMQDGGRLIHSYRAGQAKAPATASDYANMIWGALRLYQATNDAGLPRRRRALVRRARRALLGGRRRRLRLHRRRHARRDRAHARRPRRRHAQRQRDHDLQPGRPCTC